MQTLFAYLGPRTYTTHTLPPQTLPYLRTTLCTHTTLSTIHICSHTVYLIPYLSRTLRNPNRLTLPYPHNTLRIHCPNYNVPCSCTTLIIDYATQITFQSSAAKQQTLSTNPAPYAHSTHALPYPHTLYYPFLRYLDPLVSHQIKSYREANKTLAFIRSIILLIFMHKKCNIVPPNPLPHEAIYHKVNTSVHNTHTHTRTQSLHFEALFTS